VKKILRGGLAEKAGKRPRDFSAAAVERGAAVEMEHTNDREVARAIARDHLTEDPQYYERLATIESGDRGRLAWRRSSGRRPSDDSDLHRVEETTLGDRTIVIYGYSLGPKLRNFEDEHYAIRVVERAGDYRTAHEQELHFAQGFRSIGAAEGAVERWLDAHPT
jgi:hypothetical protein